MIGRWAAGALGALLASLALAQPLHHGGPGFGGGVRSYGFAPGGRDVWHRGPPAARGGARLGMSGSGGPRWGLRPTPSYGHYAVQNPYRPISAEARQMPHPPGNSNAPLRAGSIRADVARYNEERGGRPMPPPRAQDDPAHSPYFSPFYRN